MIKMTFTAFAFASALSALTLGATTASAAEPASCSTVHFADVGWTDITSTTATASILLKALGYDTDVKVLAVPVTYQSLKNKDIDVFLGNWMPSMAENIKPFADRQVGRNRSRQPRRREIHAGDQ